MVPLKAHTRLLLHTEQWDVIIQIGKCLSACSGGGLGGNEQIFSQVQGTLLGALLTTAGLVQRRQRLEFEATYPAKSYRWALSVTRGAATVRSNYLESQQAVPQAIFTAKCSEVRG